MPIHSTVGLIRSTRIILAVLLAACSHAEIPYELSRVKAHPEAVHPLKVAMLPLVDDRESGDGPDADVFQYRGIDYTATDLGDLRGEARHRITELVAGHLAKAHLFEQIILVLDPTQAPEADVVLSGRIYRMRGYVEAEAPHPKSGRKVDERMILAEVIIKDLVLTDVRNPERDLLKIDVGWSVLEPRTVGPTPWTVLAETLFVALDHAAQEIAKADFSGKYDVRAEVGLGEVPTSSIAVFGDLPSHSPHGWKFVETSSAASPIGWRGDKRCREAQLEQQQTVRFNRSQGPYRPTVWLWSCPEDGSYTFDGRVEFPSVYLGDRQGGTRYFLHALGETNWPNATSELTQHLGIERPSQRYIFELRPKKRKTTEL